MECEDRAVGEMYILALRTPRTEIANKRSKAQAAI